MSQYKVHFEEVSQPANESDTEGFSTLACGREYAERTTTSPAAVTCKMCLAAIAAQKGEKE